jgi:hypothetical protein
MSLDGPSRTIRVEPVEVPAAPQPPRRVDPPAEPAPRPAREEPAVPAR